MRLQDVHALSDVRRVPERAELPGERPACSNFLDSEDLGGDVLEPGQFLFRQGRRMIEEQRQEPMFLLVYTAPTTFPGTVRCRPDLAPETGATPAIVPMSTNICAGST